MFDIRLRLMGDDGTTKGRVLSADAITLTQNDSATPTLSFTVSEKVAGRMDAPVVVAVEYSTGAAFAQPRNGLFMASVDDSDDADPSGTVRFTGQGYVPWMLARTYLHWSPSAKNGERQWIQFPYGDIGSATPGHTLNGMLTESKARGSGPMISWDFAALTDSTGAEWSRAGEALWWSPWRLLTPISRVIDQMSSQGYMDWWTEGTKLRMFRPGVGLVLPNLVLGGPKFSGRPVKSSFDDVFTHLTVVPEKARNWLYLVNTGADNRFGRLEATMTQSGVERTDAATAAAQPTLTGGRAVKREYSFDWTPAVGGPVPFDQFNVGDVVVSKTRHGKSPQRVVGIQVSKRGGTVTARAIVGDKLLSQAAKQMQRTSAATIGGTIGGNGTALPGSQGPTYAGPSAPTALHVESNEGSWRPDGTAQATVVLAWDAVSVATDGSGIDIRAYEVADRDAAGEPAVFATTSALSVTSSVWEPGVARLVKVRAVAFNGDVSDWSEEISVTPAVPLSIVPKAPVGLAVSSNVGAFQSDGSALSTVTVQWTPVTQSLDNELVDVAEYEFKVGLDVQRVTPATATFTVPSGKAVAVTAKARTALGVWGDPSVALGVTGAVPAGLLAAPTAPVLATGQGIVFAAWGGNLVNGAPPVGFQHVVAELGLVSTGPWTRVGTPIPGGGGGVNIRGVAGETVWVRFTPIDTLGRPGTVSASASIVVKAVEVGDIDQAITDAIEKAQSDADEAQATASGKTTTYSATTVPSGVGTAVGDVWEQWSTLAIGGRLLAFWTWRAGAWVKGALDESYLPLVNIGAGTYGSLAGDRLTARTVAAEKLLVTDFQNYFNDPTFANPAGYAPWAVGGGGIEKNGTGAQQGAYHAPTDFAVTPGDRLKVTARRENVTGTTGIATIYLQRYNAAGTAVGPIAALALPTAGTFTSAEIVIPAGTVRFRVGFFTETTMPAATRVRIRDVQIRRMMAGELIVDGTMKARHIDAAELWANTAWIDLATVNVLRAGVVEASMLAAGVGGALDITANQSVNIIIGRQDAQESQLADLDDGLAGTQAAVADVDAAAAAAAAAAAGAQSTADGAVAASSELDARVSQQELYVRIGQDAMELGRPDASAALSLAPEGIEMKQNGVVVSQWVGGVFIADEARLKSALIANHQWLPYGTGRTIVRPI